jgi:hypothetical protein
MTALSRASSSLPDHETTMTDVVKITIKVSMAVAMFTIMLIVIALPILAIVSKFAMLAKITTVITVLIQAIIASLSWLLSLPQSMSVIFAMLAIVSKFISVALASLLPRSNNFRGQHSQHVYHCCLP